MQITAETMHTYDVMTSKNFAIARSYGSTLIKFLLITQHEVPFMNTSEATKRLSDRTENGKCTNISRIVEVV